MGRNYGIAPDGETASMRHHAGCVAAAAGLALAPYFWLASVVVGWPGRDAPAVDAPVQEFVDFYVDGSPEIRLAATAAVGSWALWLLLIVAVVLWACKRLDVAAVFAMVLACASVAVFVAAEGVLAWPTISLSGRDVARYVDPGVAQASVVSRDGLHAAASVLLGISMLVIAWLLARSDLWGRWLLAVVALLASVSACTTTFQGSDPVGPGGVLLWGLVVSGVVIAGHRRQDRRMS